MKKSTSKNTCYLLAGILLLIPVSLALVSTIASSITMQYWNFFLLVPYIPPIVLGIFLLLKKGNWATTICLGLMALHRIYGGINYLYNYLYLQNELFAPDFSSYYVGLAVASFFSALAYGFLTVLSFFSHQKGGCAHQKALVSPCYFVPWRFDLFNRRLPPERHAHDRVRIPWLYRTNDPTSLAVRFVHDLRGVGV